MRTITPFSAVYGPIEEATGDHPPGDTALHDLVIPGFGSGDLAKFYLVECASLDLRIELSDAECEDARTIDQLVALLVRKLPWRGAVA